MNQKKTKFDSSKQKIDSEENEVESNSKIKFNLDGQDNNKQIDTLNQKQILMKAAQNFFKGKTGDEQLPVKESIKIFNNFRIRSNSPGQNQFQIQLESSVPKQVSNTTTTNIGHAIIQHHDNKRESINLQMSTSKINLNHSLKSDVISENSTTQIKQNQHQNKNIQSSPSNTNNNHNNPSQSPTKKLQIYRNMRDEANLRMTKKQGKQNNNIDNINQQEDNENEGQLDIKNNNKQKNQSEWILQQISKFSPQLVLKLNDPIIIQAINNLNLTIDEMKQWIQVSDFYSIKESTRMQMRRYLTALNETFYKIESILQERGRIIYQKVKEKNDRSAMIKQEKFFQSFSNSRYYREFDSIKGKSLNSDRSHNQYNKSDFVNSLSINLGNEQQDGLNLSNTLGDHDSNNEAIDKQDESRKPNKHQTPQKQSQNEFGQIYTNKQLKSINQIGKFIEDISKERNNKIGNGTPQRQSFSNLNQPESQQQDKEKIDEENTNNQDSSNSTTQNGGNEQSISSSKQQKEIRRQKFTKLDLQKKLQQKVLIEERLTNLQLNEALKYEEDQTNLQVALKKKKLLSRQRKEKELHEKLEKIKERNNFVEEKKNNYDQWKIEDLNRRFQKIKELQQEQILQTDLKEKKEIIKNLQAYEREQKTQQKFQLMKEQQQLTIQELSKQRKEEHFRIDDSIEAKKQKQQNNLLNLTERLKSENEQKLKVVYKQYKQIKINEEQLAADIAKKYDQNANFRNDLLKQQKLKLQEMNEEQDRKQQENQERIQMILEQEEQIQKDKARLLNNKLVQSESIRQERMETLRKQISQNNINKNNKTLQSFYLTKEKYLQKGNQYLKNEYTNRDEYQDDVKAYQNYLKKSSAIRINKSFEREILISSPTKILKLEQTQIIRCNQFKNIDHSF